MSVYQQLYSKDFKVKDEPFEEFYIQEAVFETDVTEGNELEKCCLCPIGLNYQKLLLDHIVNNHNSQTNISCCVCPEGIELQTNLINHLLFHFTLKIENEETIENIQSQEKCSTEVDDTNFVSYFKNSKDLVNLETLSNKLPSLSDNKKKQHFNCEHCDKSFLSKQNLQKHCRNEHDPEICNRNKRKPSDSPKIKCKICPKQFKYKQGAQKHWDLEHNPLNSYECPRESCTSRCKTLKNLHAHIRTHDPPRSSVDVDNLQCHKCLKTFDTQKQLTLHFYTHREKFFCCDMCGSKFNNREQIKNHVLRHVGLFRKIISQQRIICDQCSMMVFSHKMKRHKLIHHSDERPFKCDMEGCNAAFSDSRVLRDHRNIHLELKPYKCEFCTEAFRSGANLRLHRVRHTDPDRYRCEECQASFVTKQALQKHNRLHTEDPEVRPFACDYPGCSSTFKQKDHIRNHYRRTHEKSDEIFVCSFCSKNYDGKDALGKHLRKAHKVTKRRSRVFPLNS
ncbi:CLUMA_CG013561, isoform A [Clunio marinus]|uniref:CLUMA_CG013561, isoform A n=1 Tax=Clunio marinus TaxID=568069 RepID=A0A1J1IJB4_9DIPT|nr:CLUMA_CG013561, isoform A [Clunio marinus]